MLCIPAYIFQPLLWVRGAQVVLFAALAVMNGKRIKWLYFVMMVVTITFFNLLTPIGRVLYRLGPITITAGALEQGVMKGLTIVGLVFISLFSIRPSLRLPGRLGGLIGRVFFYYERILDGKRRVQVRNLIPSIDSALEGFFTPGRAPEDRRKEEPISTTAGGFLFSAALLIVAWGSLVVAILSR